jgi:hypothetical protein
MLKFSYWVGLVMASQAIASQWQKDSEIGLCDHIFRASQRESARYAQEDPIVLWLGRPSMSLHVEGKYGPLPMPSVWVSFVNVLYVTSCHNHDGKVEKSRSDPGDNYSSRITEFMTQWLQMNPRYQLRDLYLAGDEDDLTGGKYLLSTAVLWSDREKHPELHLKGLLLGNPSNAPMISRHFGHRSFETVNGLTSWSMDRARQNIICNSRYAQVDFVMNDIQLHYTPIPTSSPSSSPSSSSPSEGMHEYQLSSISAYEKCFQSPEEWEEHSSSPGSGSAVSLLPYDIVYPTLDHPHSSSPVFPACFPPQSFQQQATSTLLEKLLARSLTILLYSSLYKSSEAICSFYIGIYAADGVSVRLGDRIPVSVSVSGSSATDREEEKKPAKQQQQQQEEAVQRRIDSFNLASLLPYESAWLTTSSQQRQSDPKALIQDGLESLVTERLL